MAEINIYKSAHSSYSDRLLFKIIIINFFFIINTIDLLLLFIYYVREIEWRARARTAEVFLEMEWMAARERAGQGRQAASSDRAAGKLSKNKQ